MSRSTVVAHSNIALAKYWGKADALRNLPAVPSLSLTLDRLTTRTEVAFDAAFERDELVLDGAPTLGRPLERASMLLDRVRALAGLREHARVESRNDFPTAAGLASSASGFAALAFAAARAAGLDLGFGPLSALARASSASAARSFHGGFVRLRAGAEEAEQVAPAEHWPLRLLVVQTARGAKSVGSTSGMQHTAVTSPYYPAWVASAPSVFAEVERAVLARDLEALGHAAEHSALAMHASMLAARPAVVYFAPITLRVLHEVTAQRARGVPAWCTMDAGPHVKVLTDLGHAESLATHLRGLEGVHDVTIASPGPAARELAP